MSAPAKSAGVPALVQGEPEIAGAGSDAAQHAGHGVIGAAVGEGAKLDRESVNAVRRAQMVAISSGKAQSKPNGHADGLMLAKQVIHAQPPGQKAPIVAAQRIDREDLRTEAALRGESIGAVALRRCRDAVDRGGHVSGAAWRALSDGLRQYLVMTCTARRDFESAALMPWQQFTADERIAMGALARSLARELKGAAWLR